LYHYESRQRIPLKTNLRTRTEITLQPLGGELRRKVNLFPPKMRTPSTVKLSTVERPVWADTIQYKILMHMDHRATRVRYVKHWGRDDISSDQLGCRGEEVRKEQITFDYADPEVDEIRRCCQ
jgi:hypothetical protein